MRLCLYCGTFNPIHKVHLEVANYIKSHFDFDKILFVPSYKPPHKNIDDNLANHRFNMVRLAIENEPKFEISDYEFRHERCSYTCNTIEDFYKLFPDIEGKISFIIGTDAFLQIESWYNTDRLKELLHFIVFPRSNDFKIDQLEHLKNKGYDFVCAEMPFIDVSSTDLRNRIKNAQPIDTLVPKVVGDYILEKGLYR